MCCVAVAVCVYMCVCGESPWAVVLLKPAALGRVLLSLSLF